MILDLLSQRLDFERTVTWNALRKLCIPIWLKSDSKLKALIEQVAKNEFRLFQVDNHQTKPEYAALWYVLTNKIAVIKQLFKVQNGMENYVKFLEKDFANDAKARTVACKNAFALISKGKNWLACAFYILGRDFKGAV